MALLSIVRAPDARLKRVSRPIAEFDAALKRFAGDMLETMYAANGIGLAAIQVGVLKRVAVIHLDAKDKDTKPLFLVNPEIVWSSEEPATVQEGCLSVPDIWEDVHRPARIRVRYQDEGGKSREIKAEGLLATCLQHEIDHINGLLFLDHISKLKRDIALRKSAKLKRQARE